jgi:hypothetical protein
VSRVGEGGGRGVSAEEAKMVVHKEEPSVGAQLAQQDSSNTAGNSNVGPKDSKIERSSVSASKQDAQPTGEEQQDEGGGGGGNALGGDLKRRKTDVEGGVCNSSFSTIAPPAAPSAASAAVEGEGMALHHAPQLDSSMNLHDALLAMTPGIK